MAITLLNGGYPPLRSGGPVDRAASATPELAPGSSQLPEVPVNQVEAIQFTSASVSLQRESRSGETPVDSEKVAALRTAIADGSYKIDSQRLAGKIIDLESRLA